MCLMVIHEQTTETFVCNHGTGGPGHVVMAQHHCLRHTRGAACVNQRHCILWCLSHHSLVELCIRHLRACLHELLVCHNLRLALDIVAWKQSLPPNHNVLQLWKTVAHLQNFRELLSVINKSHASPAMLQLVLCHRHCLSGVYTSREGTCKHCSIICEKPLRTVEALNGHPSVWLYARSDEGLGELTTLTVILIHGPTAGFGDSAIGRLWLDQHLPVPSLLHCPFEKVYECVWR